MNQEYLRSLNFWMLIAGLTLDVTIAGIFFAITSGKISGNYEKTLKYWLEASAILAGLLVLFAIIGENKVAKRDAQTIQNLEAKQQPRTISPAQREKFISRLRDVPRGNVEVHIDFNSGDEIKNYAEQIRRMVSDAGYQTGQMCSMSLGGHEVPAGILIFVKDPAKLPVFAGPVISAFKEIGIDALPSYGDPAVSGEGIRVVVGSKL